MLKVPVIVAVLKGTNLLNPCWARKVRRKKLEIEYKILFAAEQVMSLSDDEMYKQLTGSLSHDKVEYQHKHMNIIYSDSRAGQSILLCMFVQNVTQLRAGNNF